MAGEFEDMQKISKTNMDAMTKSFGALPQTVQAIATEMVEYSKRSFESGIRAMEKLRDVKSLDKVFEVQTEYAKTAYQDYIAQVTKFGELYANLAKEAFKPFESYLAKASIK
jgi:hypothetical protein